jgi:kinesin family protein 3/17
MGFSAAQANVGLLEKLKALEAKVMVGGENLLEKAELQEKLLAASEKELEERRNREQQLRSELEKRQAEIMQIEESYETLQEESTEVNKKLKKVFALLTSAKSELSDMHSEYGKLREELLETIRATSKENKLASFIINNYIPGEHRNRLNLSHQTIHFNLKLISSRRLL